MSESADQVEAVEFSRQIPLVQLGDWHERLVRALIESGVSAERAMGVLQRNLRIRCCQCGYTIAGVEFVMTGTAPGQAIPCQAKIARLASGYCARKGCPSHYCDLLFHPTGEVDWVSTWAIAEKRPPDTLRLAAELESHRTSFWESLETRYGRQRVVACAIATVALVLLLHSCVRAPSWSRGQSPYRADPASAYGVVPP